MRVPQVRDAGGVTPRGVEKDLGLFITLLAVLHLRRHPDTWKQRRRDSE